MRWRRESRLALGLAVAAGLLLGVALSGAEGAGPQKRADDLRRKQSGLEARSHQALLGLYALDSRLVTARADLSRIRSRVVVLRQEEGLVRRELGVVRDNLQVSRRLLGDRLRLLYEEGEPNAMAVLLGSTSLDDAVTRLDELERSANEGAQVAAEAKDGREHLNRLASALALRVQQAQALAARAERTAVFLAGARAARLAYLTSLAGQRRLTARQIGALEARARSVTKRAQAVQAQSSPDAAQGASAVAAGPRTITVTASGYSLPGRTSTGLPVGAGVVAVDPAVIPLGTRLTIPGYGDGVAADTGSAVNGNAIDLWFPTLADALAWGRRTVTITLH